MTCSSGTLPTTFKILLEALELRDVALAREELRSDGHVAGLREAAAHVLDVLVHAEDSWTTRTSGNGPLPSGIARYAGIAPIFTSPATRPEVSVVMVSAETGLTASAKPAAREVTTKARRERSELIAYERYHIARVQLSADRDRRERTRGAAFPSPRARHTRTSGS